MLDARKPLDRLKKEWVECTACDLGERRDNEGGRFVFGEGVPRGILFVGEGPGETEESTGRPFVGRSGKILRFAINKYGIEDVSYITNAVACRSCRPQLDGGGQPVFKKARGGLLPVFRDEAPNRVQLLACRPRLFEQIYLLDPLLIVALGSVAASALLQENVSIMAERGIARSMEIPGATEIASVTPKGTWARRSPISKQIEWPTEPNAVEYMVLPTLHPAFILRSLADKSPNGAGALFMKDIGVAASIYRRYLIETGVMLEEEIIPPEEDPNLDDFED